MSHRKSVELSDGQPTRSELPIFRTEERRANLMAIYEEKLNRWPIPFDASLVATRYGKTHVIASGDPASPPLVLIHPMGVGAFVWAPIIATLSGGYRTYALDTIGDIGKSELDDANRYPKKGGDYSAWLDDVYVALDIERADLVAGSMGGWIALNHAICAPDRVDSLSLLGPMGIAPWRSSLGILGPLMSQALRPSGAKLDKLTSRGLGEGDAVNRELRPWMTIAGWCRPRTGLPLRISGKKLRTIAKSTLIILGGKDGAIGSADAAAARAQRTIPGCAIEVLPTAGHLMNFDEPKLIATKIVSFLRAYAMSKVEV